MNKKKIKVICLSIVICMGVFTSGCYILPIPHYKIHISECMGRVIDSETNEPIQGAKVTVSTQRYSQQVLTEEDGMFRVKKGGWHLIMWCGIPSSGSLLPTHLDNSDEFIKRVEVEADGYEKQILYGPRYPIKLQRSNVQH